MTYRKEFLIEKLQEFAKENNRSPVALDMKAKYGYPSYAVYLYAFGSWNNSLKAAGLSINKKIYRQKLDGTETCSYCGKRADEIPNFAHWLYHDGVRYCMKHFVLPKYLTNDVNINSTKGLSRVAQLVATKALNIDKHESKKLCDNNKVILHNKMLGNIDIKVATIFSKVNGWHFQFTSKKKIDTYVLIGLSDDKKHVEHVWLLPNTENIKKISGITILNTNTSLYNKSEYEIDNKVFDEIWQQQLYKSTQKIGD